MDGFVKKEIRRTVSMRDDFTNRLIGEEDDIVLTMDKKGNEFFLRGKCNITGIERTVTFTEQHIKSLPQMGIDVTSQTTSVLFNEINSYRNGLDC